MKKICAFVLLFSTVYLNQSIAQSWTWNMQTGFDALYKKLSCDKSNKIYSYTLGYLWNNSSGDTIFKMNLQGQSLGQMVLPAGLSLRKLVHTPDTGLYLSGTFSGTATVGSITYTTNGGQDIWVSRYNSAGNLLWFKTIGGKGNDIITDICLKGTGLAMTGSVEDTINFLGQQFPKDHEVDFFVAAISGSGTLQGLKLSLGTHSAVATYPPRSGGINCASDPAGNIYVSIFSVGENHVDTFRVGIWGDYPKWDPMCWTTLVKFDAALQPQHVTLLQECIRYCGDFRDLVVNTRGDAYIVQTHDYGQSGNDDHWNYIHQINTAGRIMGRYQLRPDQNSEISALKLDACDNLYFTGSWRNANMSNWTPYYYYSFVTAQLSPSLTVNWMVQDSSRTNRAWGTGLAVIGHNDCFVGGIFEDSLTLATSMVTSTNKAGFLARITAPSTINCGAVNSTAIDENEKASDGLYFYPNPSEGILHFSENCEGEEVQVSSMQGQLLLRAKVTQNKIDAGRLQTGIYFINVNSRSGVKTGKLILE